MAKKRKRSISIEALREEVHATCERELAAIATREGSVSAEDFLIGLLMLRADRVKAQAAVPAKAKADAVRRAVKDLAVAAERGREALRGLDLRAVDWSPAADLRDGINALWRSDFLRQMANRPRRPLDDAGVRRLDVLIQFANDNFMGLRRLPTAREIALLCLFFDPDYGCSDRRSRNEEAVRTAAEVIKHEVDVVRTMLRQHKLFRVATKPATSKRSVAVVAGPDTRILKLV